MSGLGGWKEDGRYRRAAASSTPFSSQSYLWDGNNKTEEAENPQNPQTTSEKEQSGQASVYQQQQEQ